MPYSISLYILPFPAGLNARIPLWASNWGQLMGSCSWMVGLVVTWNLVWNKQSPPSRPVWRNKQIGLVLCRILGERLWGTRLEEPSQAEMRHRKTNENLEDKNREAEKWGRIVWPPKDRTPFVWGRRPQWLSGSSSVGFITVTQRLLAAYTVVIGPFCFTNRNLFWFKWQHEQ